ncbi:MAG TPA: histidine--tRNA ligase [Pyrinomonadaceae bacterium]|nr:histidine--tRNA ligase [Pyrinomonadaceae bacterium]
MSNTQPARGMRDFLPADIRKREYVIGVIKEVYQKYGFEPLETPSVENLETLMGKYGEEGNQLIFKILKRGEKLDVSAGEKGLSDLALRYDLTVPLARVVANYKDKLPKFFKRYQIQPVWRADRPARGRFREFYQCDVDAIGSKSMIVEAELISAVCEILWKLGFEDFAIKLNHRKLLTSMLEYADIPEDKHIDALVALDKLEKIGSEDVGKEFIERGIKEDSGNRLLNFLWTFFERRRVSIKEAKVAVQQVWSENQDKTETSKLKEIHELNYGIIEKIEESLGFSNSGRKAIVELRRILENTKETFGCGKIIIDLTLARGLSYYTGAIFEIILTEGDFKGSIGGGGRYDGLIGMFGKEQIPACGFSLGLERILVVMEERGMFDKLVEEGKLSIDSADVMIACFDENLVGESLKLAAELREKNLRVLVYPEASQKAKPMKYAEQIKVPFVCLLKQNEASEVQISLKNMQTSEQEISEREMIAERIKN